MPRRRFACPRFAHSCDERTAMATLILLLGLLLLARLVLGLVRLWRAIPRRNADFEVFR